MNMRARRGLLIIALLLSPFIIGLLLTYQWVRIPFDTDMAENMAVDYQEGPRLSPPQGAIPIQGEAVLGDEFPINPITSDDTSLQRGQILYDVHCALCHGLQGLGDGPLAEHFQRIPVDLASSAAVNEFDGSVYLVILQGFGQMPSLSENLTIREHWDVVNYVRTLTEPTGVK